MAIESIAIIGAGPSGLTSLYELLHTSKNGNSTVGSTLPKDPAFNSITVFEQQTSLGGIWNTSLDKTDPSVPNDEVLKTNKYNDPYHLKPPKPIPTDLKKDSCITIDTIQDKYEQWSRSAVYENLYTNIPNRLMRFSYTKQYKDVNERLDPFLTHHQVKEFLQHFAKDQDLIKYIRFNTEVESVKFDHHTDKWTVISRTFDSISKKDIWKKEQYDGIIVAGGRLNVPYFPLIDGLSDYILKYPNVVSHSKSFRNSEEFRDKTVLIIGGSVSSVDLIQYLFPKVKKLFVSRRTEKAVYEWMERAITSEGILTKPQIKKFNELDGTIEFIDGSRIDKPDSVILATGYHFHFPFLEKGVVNLSSSIIHPSNAPRVQDLYLHVFHNFNPSLAFVGIPAIATVWYGFEAEAAAIAGVWSGASSLPNVQGRLLWASERLAQTGDSSKFQVYYNEIVRSGLLDRLIDLAPIGRQHPLDLDEDAIPELIEGQKTSERIFYELKEGRTELFN